MMRKTIPLTQLALGMTVTGMDKSWLETPFFRHRIEITDSTQIDKLKSCGVTVVEVEGEFEAEVETRTDHEHVETVAPAAAAIEPPAAPPTEGEAFDEELRLARQVHDEAKKIVEQTMHDVRMGREINTEAVGRVVDSMMDSLLRHPDALTSLSRLKSFDQYTFFHSVNTAMLALALGRKLQFDQPTLHWLGAGTLLHDIGKMKVPLEILNKPGKFEAWEFEVMKQHTMRGVDILSQIPHFDDIGVRPALEHHERLDGTGYMFGKNRANITPYGMIASIVDIYDAITSDRCYHKAMPPYKALQHLYDLAKRAHVDSLMVQRFVQCVGVYPVGSCVVLDNGEIGIVRRIHHERPVDPELILVRDSQGHPLPSIRMDLSLQDTRKITAVRDPHDFKIDVAAYLDQQPVAA